MYHLLAKIHYIFQPFRLIDVFAGEEESDAYYQKQWSFRYPNAIYLDAPVYGRFYLGTYMLFCLINPEFNVPDPDDLFFLQNSL